MANKSSQTDLILTGVPKGSVLGPILFNSNVHDMAVIISSKQSICIKRLFYNIAKFLVNKLSLARKQVKGFFLKQTDIICFISAVGPCDILNLILDLNYSKAPDKTVQFLRFGTPAL